MCGKASKDRHTCEYQASKIIPTEPPLIFLYRDSMSESIVILNKEPGSTHLLTSLVIIVATNIENNNLL